MDYKLKNGKNVIIRKPTINDALAIINLITVADTETKFLARNAGEFKVTEEQEKELQAVKGEQMDNAFGSQIRSYVMHPYSMVKDHRTNYETSNVGGVLDGDIDAFIESNLKKRL